MSVIEAKQVQPFYKSRTVLAGVSAIVSVLITMFILRQFPDLLQYSSTIFTAIFSFFGAIVLKYIGTDFLSIIGQIVMAVWADKKIDEQDFQNILLELLTEQNELDATAVQQVELKMIDKGLIKTKVVGVS